MKATIVTPFMLSPLTPVAIGGSSADFRNYLLSRAFIRGNQKPRSPIIFVNFYNFVNLLSTAPVGGSGMMIFQSTDLAI
jgi:hypothetical protein